VRQCFECRDAHHATTLHECEPLNSGDADAQPRERSWSRRDGKEIDAVQRRLVGRGNRENLAGQTLRMSAGLVAAPFSDHAVVIDDGDASAASRRIERQNSHHAALSSQLSALGYQLSAKAPIFELKADR
jgi:hypothetical protein